MSGRIVTRDFSGREVNPDDGSPVMLMESAGRALRGMAAELVEDLKEPPARAGFVSSMLTSALLARRLGFLPTLAIALLVGVSVEHLYGMAQDIHDEVTGKNARMPAFHGVTGCRGHYLDEGYIWTEDCSDAPGKV